MKQTGYKARDVNIPKERMESIIRQIIAQEFGTDTLSSEYPLEYEAKYCVVISCRSSGFRSGFQFVLDDLTEDGEWTHQAPSIMTFES